MRRLWFVFFALACACNQPANSPPVVPLDPKLKSRVEVAAPDAERALKQGFFAVEQGQWRWTAPRFTVQLAPPKLVLRVRLTVPTPELEQNKKVTLSARLNGQALAPETYDHAGDYVYERPIGVALGSTPAQVELEVSPPFKPGGADQRELGLVVYAIGIEQQ